MGTFDKMKKAMMRKQMRDLSRKISNSAADPQKQEKYQEKLDNVVSKYPGKVQGYPKTSESVAPAKPAYTPPAKPAYTPPSPPPKPAATVAPPVQKPTAQAPAKPTVSADTGPIPIIRNSYGQNATGSVGASASDPSLPKIPSGNRFHGHDALISRIAKDIVDGVFGHFKPVQWYQVPSQQWVLHFEIYVSIEKDYIKVSSAKGGYYTTISFVKYNMRSIPDVNMFAFAINPFIEYFAKKRAEETFGRVSYLSKYKLSFRLDKHAVSFTTDQYVFKPHFELDQYLLPSKSLNSW